MFEFFLVLFWESAFSALDSSNCQMRKKKDQLYYLFLFWGGEGREGLNVSSCCQYEEFVNLEHVDMYIFY